MENIEQFISTSGGYIHHIGMLTDDTKRTLAGLNRMPGIGPWTGGESTWKQHEMVVGNENTMLCSTAKILNGMLLEVIEPVKGKSEDTYFTEYVNSKGAGIHHICYGIPHYEDYQKIYDYLIEIGCKDVVHGRKKDANGNVTDEFCYLEIQEGEMYLELCLTRYKWGY